jgi:hypothetical protein
MIRLNIVILVGCRLMAKLSLIDGQIPLLDLSGSWVLSLDADRLDVTGSIFLRQGFHAQGEVWLLGAHVGGNVDCMGGSFQNPLQTRIAEGGKIEKTPGTGTALIGDGINVKGNIILREGFHAHGEVRLPGAQIGINLDCDGGKFENPSQSRTNERGEVETVRGTGTALIGDGINVKGQILLREGFQAHGEVRLPGARIGINLDCDGGKFENPSQSRTNERGEVETVPGTGTALNAQGINVKGNIFLRQGFHSQGEVRLANAQIGANLDCHSGKFDNVLQTRAAEGGKVQVVLGTGTALNADGINVKGSVFLRQGFDARGEVRLPGAQIAGNFECDGGRFARFVGTGKALNAGRINVRGSVFFRTEFHAQNEVWIVGAQIGGNLDCVAGRFTTLIAQTATITGNILWYSVRCPGESALDLTNASAGSIADEQVSWPSQGHLSLDGFIYGRISGGPRDAKTRLEWLARAERLARSHIANLPKFCAKRATRAARKRFCMKWRNPLGGRMLESSSGGGDGRRASGTCC